MQALTDLRKRFDRALPSLAGKVLVDRSASELLEAAGIKIHGPGAWEELRAIERDLERLEDQLWGIEPLGGAA